MQLKVNENGKVPFLLITGRDKVQGEMVESEAKSLINNGKVKESKGTYTVNDKFIFFDEDYEEPKQEPKKETEKNIKKDDVPLSEGAKKGKKVSEKKKINKNVKEKTLSNKPIKKK